MRHTLNEQVLTLQHGSMDYDAFAQYIINSILALTGWEVDEDDNTKIYPESSHQFYIKPSHDSGGSTLVWTLYYGAASQIINPSISLTTDHTVYFHRSRGETVQYFSIDHTWQSTWLFASNAGGDTIMFMGQNGTVGAYNGSRGSQGVSLSFASGQTGNTYAISKLPDTWNNSTFPELYFAWSVASPFVENQLIAFATSNDVYRLVPQVTTQHSRLAFPVADDGGEVSG